MIILNKCSGSCNSVDELSTKICVLSKTKDINVKVCNMITRTIETKTMVKHFSWDYKYKSYQKWNNETCQCLCKNYRKCKKYYSWNPSTCICENGKYLKSVTDDTKIVCDETRYFMDIVSTNVTNTIPTNVSRNSDGKKVIYN